MKASTIAFGLEAPFAALEGSGPAIGLDNTGDAINSVVDPPDLANAGDWISYFFWAYNPGNVDLSNVVVTASNVSGITRGPDLEGDNDDTLEAHEIWGYFARYTLTADDIANGEVANIAMAAASVPGGGTVEIQDDLTVVLTTKRPDVAIMIGKSGKVDNAIIAPSNRTDVGDIINYSFVVSNPGIIDLTNVIVADASVTDLTRGIDVTGNNDDTLDAGEIWSYSASYTITEANIAVGVVVNYASVTATQPNGDTIADDVTSPVLLQTAGSGILQLVPTENGKGVTVLGPEGQGLWVELTVVGALAGLQNSLNLLLFGGRLVSGGSGPNGSERARALGSAPIAPEPGVLGGKRYVFLQSGQELQFTQSTGQLPTVLDPTLTVAGTDPQILLNLDDGGGGPDADFNDLVVNIRSVDFTPDADYVMGRIQSDATAGFLDLTGEAANGIELTLESFSELDNILSFVKIDIDPDNITGGAFSVGGVTPDQGQAFRDAVAANLVDFSLDLGGNGSSTTAFWDPAESGLYAPVLLTGNGDLLTFGPSGTADGLAHLKVLGQNKFGFEDLLASQGSDWDFNDLLLTAQVV